MRTPTSLSRSQLGLVFLSLLLLLMPGCKAKPKIKVSPQAKKTTAKVDARRRPEDSGRSWATQPRTMHESRISRS